VTLPGLSHTMTIYTEDSAGRYLTVAASGVRCRLYPIGAGGATGPARAELAALRRLFWEPPTIISEHAQIEVDGTRYNVIAGTVQERFGPTGTLSHYEGEVMVARNG
jgi:hypothetical protein